MNDTKKFTIDVNTNDAVKSTESLNSQLKSLQKEMTELIAAGKENSKEFEELSKRAGTLKDAIGDAQQHIKRMADDTKGLNDVLDVTKTSISVFGLLQSATAALGLEDTKLAKSIQTLQAAQTALNSVQQLQATLMDKSSATYKLLNSSIITYTGTSKSAAIATKALNVAIKGLGIGLIVAAVVEISNHIDDIRDGLSNIFPFLKDETKELERQKQLEEERNNEIKKRLEVQQKREKVVRDLKILRGEAEDVYQEDLDKALKKEQALTDELKRRQAVAKEYGTKENKELVEQAQYNLNVATKERLEAEKTLQAEKERKKVKESTVKVSTKNSNIVEPKVGAESDLFFKNGVEEIVELNDEYIPILEEQALTVIGIFNKIKNEGELTDEEREQLQEFYDTIDGIKTVSTLIGEGSDTIFSVISTSLDNEVNEIEKSLQKVEKAINKTDKTIDKHKSNLETLYSELAESEGAKRDALLESIEVERTALNEQYTEQERLEKEQAIREKELEEANAKKEKADLANQLVKSIANTAISISTSMQAGFPAAIPFIAMAAATGAVQTGIIASQLGKLKYANGGILEGPSHSMGGIPVGNTGIEVEGGEYVVNKRATSRYLPLLEALNSYGSSKSKFANGGELNLPESDSLRTLTSINFTPVVAVTDINKANSRLSKVRVR